MPTNPSAPAIDLHRVAVKAMTGHGLRPAFSAGALDEARAAAQAGPARPAALRDLRHLAWFSIDNDDTRDLDQLSVAERLPDGATRLLVAIADVDCMVRPGGAIAAHAAANTTSVYTAAGVFPMLPELLSTDLTSLHEGMERQAIVVDMRIAADGAVGDAQLYAALVVNRAKLAYPAVSAWLDGDAPAPSVLAALTRVPGLEEQLRIHDDVANRLRAHRQAHGALNLGANSPRPVFEGGVLVDIRPDAKSRAKDLIADLMIAANGATARFLVQRGFPSLRRFLQAPRRWDRVEALAAERGERLPDEPDAVALDRFLTGQRAKDPAGFADLSLAVVKLLGAGTYTAAPAGARGQGQAQGHFGLAVNDYAHSTAPNRRYPDLVTQRLVKAALAGESSPYTYEQLQAIAEHCTVQEGNAAKVERAVLKSAGAYLLQNRIGEVFDALVTGASAKGVFVRIASPVLEGRLVRGFENADVGDCLRVRLTAVDAVRSHIDFERA